MRKINAYEPGIIKITKKETQNYEKESNRFTGTGICNGDGKHKRVCSRCDKECRRKV